MAKGINFSGDIDITAIDLYSKTGNVLSIKPQVMSVEIYESVFEPFTTAKISVDDNIGIFDLAPLTGEEILRISARTPTLSGNEDSFDFAFHVYSLSHRSPANGRTASYLLHCVSIEAFTDSVRKISKSYKGNISDIVKGLLTDTDYGLGTKKGVNVEPTSNSVQYVSNFWSPMKNITFLTEHAMSVDGSPSYLIFENRDGFNFCCLETMYKGTPIQTFTKDNFVRGGEKTKNVERNYANIISLQTDDFYDFYKKSKNGVFGSTLHSYDLTFKLHSSREFNPAIHGKDITKINMEKPLNDFSADPNSLHMNMVTQHSMYPNEPTMSNESTYQKMKYIKNTADYLTIQISVQGRSDYKVGYVVALDVPRDAPIDKQDSKESSINKMLSGKYIIAEINHAINGKQHQTTLTLIRDSVDI